MFEESIRIPMIVVHPDWVLAPTGPRRHMVLNIDVMPTILYACGLAAHNTVDGVPVQEFERRGGLQARDHFIYEYKLDPLFCLGIRTERWKYSWYAKAEKHFLFDLVEDPYERHNRANEPAFAALRTDFEARLKDEFGSTNLWPDHKDFR